MPHTIRCAHCKQTHETSREVQFCARYGSTAITRPPTAAAVVAARSTEARPKAWPLTTPQQLVEGIRSGRYAVSPSDEIPLTFIRVSRPKSGKKAGCLVVQTQHSDTLVNRLVVYPSGKWWLDERIHIKRKLDETLLLASLDEVGCAMRYASEKGVCSRCGKTLTDVRSRFYGIGPECEQHWADMIESVEAIKGPFVPGVSA